MEEKDEERSLFDFFDEWGKDDPSSPHDWDHWRKHQLSQEIKKVQ